MTRVKWAVLLWLAGMGSRDRVDGERTSAAFADRIRDEVEIHAVATELAATVDRSIRSASQGLWLRGAAE